MRAAPQETLQMQLPFKPTTARTSGSPSRVLVKKKKQDVQRKARVIDYSSDEPKTTKGTPIVLLSTVYL